MWPSHDNGATTCHAGHLVGHPPCWHTWVLGVPSLFSCYSCLICIIDVPFSGARTGGPVSSLIPNLGVICMLPCILSLAPSPIPLMWTAAIVTDVHSRPQQLQYAWWPTSVLTH